MCHMVPALVRQQPESSEHQNHSSSDQGDPEHPSSTAVADITAWPGLWEILALLPGSERHLARMTAVCITSRVSLLPRAISHSITRIKLARCGMDAPRKIQSRLNHLFAVGKLRCVGTSFTNWTLPGVAAADSKTLATQIPCINLAHLVAAAVKFAALESQDTEACPRADTLRATVEMTEAAHPLTVSLWVCPVCTFDNHIEALQCEICNWRPMAPAVSAEHESDVYARAEAVVAAAEKAKKAEELNQVLFNSIKISMNNKQRKKWKLNCCKSLDQVMHRVQELINSCMSIHQVLDLADELPETLLGIRAVKASMVHRTQSLATESDSHSGPSTVALHDNEDGGVSSSELHVG